MLVPLSKEYEADVKFGNAGLKLLLYGGPDIVASNGTYDMGFFCFEHCYTYSVTQ